MTTTDDRNPDPDVRTMQRVSTLCALTIVVGIVAQSSFYTVESGETALVARFGELIETVGPGLHVKLPFGIDEVVAVSTKAVRSQESGFRGAAGGDAAVIEEERAMITRDLSIVDLQYAIQYQVNDPLLYVSSVREPDEFLRDAGEMVIRTIVGQTGSVDLLTTAGHTISSETQKQLQRYLDDHKVGLSISSVDVREVSPPKAVQAAFDAVDEARQEKERMVNDANRSANTILPRAEGAASKIVAEAEAEALKRANLLDQETLMFNTAFEYYKRNPDIIRKSIYLNALRFALPNAGKIIVGTEGQSAPQSVLYLNGTGAE